MTYQQIGHQLALNAEHDWAALGAAHQAAYSRLAKQLPYMLRTTGLAPTIIFLDTKSQDRDTAHLLLENLAHALGHANANALYQAALQVNHPTDYLRLIKEALDYAVWIKRVSAGGTT